MLDASFKLFSRERVGGEGKRAHTMEGETKKEDGEGGGGRESQTHTHTHARTHARTHTHTHTHTHSHTHSHHRGRHEVKRGGRLLWLSASQIKFV